MKPWFFCDPGETCASRWWHDVYGAHNLGDITNGPCDGLISTSSLIFRFLLHYRGRFDATAESLNIDKYLWHPQSQRDCSNHQSRVAHTHKCRFSGGAVENTLRDKEHVQDLQLRFFPGSHVLLERGHVTHCARPLLKWLFAQIMTAEVGPRLSVFCTPDIAHSQRPFAETKRYYPTSPISIYSWDIPTVSHMSLLMVTYISNFDGLAVPWG